MKLLGPTHATPFYPDRPVSRNISPWMIGMHKLPRILVRAAAVLVALLAVLQPAAALADDKLVPGNVDVSVTVTAATPTVTFDIYSDSSYTTPTTDLVPQTQVYMKIDVSTDNVMEEVSVKVDMFADNDASTVGTIPTATSPSTHVTFTISYDSTNGKWVLNADTGGSNTWIIQLDPNQQQPDPTATSGTFYVIIVPGKTAAEASTSENADYADWDIVVTATVAGTASNTASKSGLVMYFYGEVQPAATSLDFGSLQPGTKSSVQSLDVTVIANGDFDLKVVAPAQLTTSDGYTISLTTNPPGLGEFRMNASLTYDSTTGELTNSVVLTSSIDTTPALVSAADGPTQESGETYTIYFQLELGTGIHTGTYGGTMQVYAADTG